VNGNVIVPKAEKEEKMFAFWVFFCEKSKIFVKTGYYCFRTLLL
jgi:hypothetical protein